MTSLHSPLLPRGHTYVCVAVSHMCKRTSAIMFDLLLLVLLSVPVLFIMYWYDKYLIKGKDYLTKGRPAKGYEVTSSPHSDEDEEDDDGSPQRVLALLHESLNRNLVPRAIVWD